MIQKDIYLSKLERFFKEEEFILSRRIEDEVTERALLYALEVAVEISMDIIAMRIRDVGLRVEDDATNIEKIASEGIISKSEADFLCRTNGLRNFIVHRYNKLDMDIVNEALSRVDELKGIIIKIAEY